jgi:hypothetical protein
MSNVPPVPPAQAAALPWESRSGRDPVGAFVETARLFATNPDEAWRVTAERGGIEAPLLYGLIISLIGSIVSFVYRWIFVSPFARMMSGPAFRRFGWMAGRHPRGCGIVFFPIGAAVGIVIGLFIGAAILHLFVLLVGAARTSASGFEGTFRVVAYASTASVAQVIPFVGGLIALVWWIVLAVKGIQRMHRTTSGRAVAAVLLPMAVLAVCVFIAIVVAIGLFFAVAHRPPSTL